MAVRVYRIFADSLIMAIRANGYNPRIYTPDDIRRPVYRILIDDIRAGETDWPVETGYSRSAFFTDGNSLMNEAPYAAALESGRRAKGRRARRRNFIKDYLSRELNAVVLAALELIGARPGMAPESQMELPRVPRLGIDLARDLVLPENVPGSIARLVFSYDALSARNRRLLRLYRPLQFLHSTEDLPFVRDT